MPWLANGAVVPAMLACELVRWCLTLSTASIWSLQHGNALLTEIRMLTGTCPPPHRWRPAV
jgi:hypothetical protein